MAGSVVRLRTQEQRLKEEQASHLRQLLLAFPGGLPERPLTELLATLDRNTAADSGWTFVMLSPAQNAAVVQWLAKHSQRPQVAMRLWAELFTALRMDTGEIALTRDEIAERLDIQPRHVSEVMGELEAIGAISRLRQRVAGMRGRGMVRYFMNPTVATHLGGEARRKAQEEAPQLRLVE
jgi:CRP-like cAMP-binding protein